MKEIRLNANKENSKRIKELQAKYNSKARPAKVSLDALANLCMEYGIPIAQDKLNLK